MEPRSCARCGGTRLEPGGIQSTGRLYFRPANAPFWTLRTADVSVTAYLCLDCGVLEFVGDIAKAESLVGRRATTDAELDASSDQGRM